MNPFFDKKKWLETPEGRFRLFRIFYLISLGMLVLGFILIIISLLFFGGELPR